MRPVLERSALELAGAIRRGELTATEVVAAHIEQHRRAAPRLGAIAADRYEAAEREAAAADQRVTSASDPAEETCG